MEADIIKTLRLIHLYPGVFIAPAVLFFALTGILQTFSLRRQHGSWRSHNFTRNRRFNCLNANLSLRPVL